MSKPISVKMFYLTTRSTALGGAAYSVGSILTLNGGTSTTAAQVQVLSVSGGLITSLGILTPGNYTIVPPNPVSLSTTSGTGSGATLNAVWHEIEEPYTTIVMYGSNVSGTIPPGNSLANGELFINIADAIIYVGDSLGRAKALTSGTAGTVQSVAVASPLSNAIGVSTPTTTPRLAIQNTTSPTSQFLRGDGQWSIPQLQGGGAVYDFGTVIRPNDFSLDFGRV